MTDGFISVPVETNVTKVVDDALDYMIAHIEGWLPSDAHVETWLIQTIARLALYRARVDAQVPTAIFRFFGVWALGLPPINAAPASGATTWTFVDDAGYTIPAGTTVAFRTAGDQLIPFVVTSDVVVPPGFTTSVGGAVPIRAVSPGVAGNGLSGAVELVDTLASVVSIETAGSTSGGVEGETDIEYLGRLTSELQLLSPRPILPTDFAVMARRVAGVHRALAIDGYNPDDETDDNERMVAVAVIDADGGVLSSGVKDAVDELLQSEREINFVVNVIDPAFTDITVVFTATGLEGYNTGAVEAAAVAALDDYLSPGSWGGGQETVPAWRPKTIVRYLEIAQVINNTPGVDEITTLTVNGGTADVTLDGIAPLPRPLNNAGTVT